MMFLYSVQDKYRGGLDGYREDGFMETPTIDSLVTELKQKSENIMKADGFFDSLDSNLSESNIEDAVFDNIDCIFWIVENDFSLTEKEEMLQLLTEEGLDYVVKKYTHAPYCSLSDYLEKVY